MRIYTRIIPELKSCAQCGEIIPYRGGNMTPGRYRKQPYCSLPCSWKAAITPLPEVLARHTMNERGCWVWTGYRTKKGYGQFASRDPLVLGEVLMHRISFIYHNGQLSPEKPQVLHHCDNPPCFNPAHLYAGTNDDNMRDRMERDRNWHPRGELGSRSKLYEEEVIEIFQSVEGTTSLAKRFCVSTTTIKDIRNGKIWSHLFSSIPE